MVGGGRWKGRGKFPFSIQSPGRAHRRIGANPKTRFSKFRGPTEKISELCVLLFVLGKPWRQICQVAGRESRSPELLEVPRTSPEVPQLLPRKLSQCGTNQQSRDSPEVSQTSPEVLRTSPEVSWTSPSWLTWIFSENNQASPKLRFSKPVSGHATGSSGLDRPHHKQFWP